MEAVLRRTSIRARLLAFLLLGGLLPVAVLGAYVSVRIGRELRANLGKRLAVEAEDLRDRIDRDLFETLRGLETVAADPSASADLAGAFRRIEERRGSARTSILSLALVGPDGAVLRRAGRPGAPDPAEYRAALPPAVAGEAAVSEVLRLGDAPVVLLSLPVVARGARPPGILLAALDVRSLAELARDVKIVRGLMRESIVYRGGVGALARTREGAPLFGDAHREFPLLAGGEEIVPGAVHGRLADGRPALAADRPLEGLRPPLDRLGWRVAVVQPLDDPSEETVDLVARVRRGILLASATAILASIVLSALLLRSITRPLRGLEAATRRVREGDLEGRIEPEGSDELAHLASFFNEMVARIKEMLDRLSALARTDALTGLPNRRVFHERLAEEIARTERYGRPLCLGVLDIDDFKKLNDSHGHECGDSVLAGLARLFGRMLRTTDLAARFGGEEFVLVLPETEKEQAWKVLDRLRAAVSAHRFEGASVPAGLRVTVSLGVASFPGDAAVAEDLFSAADKALYRAKEGGKNRVVAAGA